MNSPLVKKANYVWKSKSQLSCKQQRTQSGSVSLVCTKMWHWNAYQWNILCDKAKQFNKQLRIYMHKKQLPHCSRWVLVGYGVFVSDMVFVGCVCKVKSSQLTKKLLNHSRKSYRMLWSARGSHLSKFTIVMKQGYIIKCFLHKPLLAKLKKCIKYEKTEGTSDTNGL